MRHEPQTVVDHVTVHDSMMQTRSFSCPDDTALRYSICCLCCIPSIDKAPALLKLDALLFGEAAVGWDAYENAWADRVELPEGKLLC